MWKKIDMWKSKVGKYVEKKFIENQVDKKKIDSWLRKEKLNAMSR